MCALDLEKLERGEYPLREIENLIKINVCLNRHAVYLLHGYAKKTREANFFQSTH